MLNSGEAALTVGQTLGLLAPEIVLLLTALLALGFDLVPQLGPRKRRLPYVVLAGLAGALVATLALWNWDARLLSVLSRDTFGLAVNVITLVATGIVVLIGSATPQTRGPYRYRGTLHALLILSALATCLLGAATDLVVVILAFELLSVSSYLLIGQRHGNPYTIEAASKYLLYSAILSTILLYGFSWLYGLTGHTDLEGIAAALIESESAVRQALLPGLILTTAGLAFKVAAVPFHQWAPDVYEGTPTPTTAFFSVIPVIAGFAALMRVLITALPADLESLDVDWHTLLFVLSVLSMTAGNLVALWQEDLKRMLAYTGIAQAGYLLVGVVAASPHGVVALLLNLAAYALSTLGAFAAIAALFNEIGSYRIEDYTGVHQWAPELAWPLLLCLLSLAGVPPTAGFVGRAYLFSAAMEEGLHWLAIVGVVNSVISLACYWKIIRAMFVAPAQARERIPVPPLLAAALAVTVTGIFVVAVFSGPLLALLRPAARALFG